MKKHLITNLVYGPLYFKIFVERHLPSVLDPTNLESAKEHGFEITYLIFTDQNTAELLKEHPQVKRLASYAKVDIQVFELSNPAAGYDARYPILMQVCKDSIKYALENKFDFVTAWVADLVVARDFFPRLWLRVSKGHDAVFVLPARAAFESTSRMFQQQNRAFRDLELCAMAIDHMHPLWTACVWPNESFTRMPYAIVFRAAVGLVVRSYSITPIIFTPSPELLSSPGMIDGDIPQHFKNPYWCEDWIDAPVVGTEPIFCHYPVSVGVRSSISYVKGWAHRKQNPPIHPSQRSFIKHRLYYPSKAIVKMNWFQKLKSDFIAWRLS